MTESQSQILNLRSADPFGDASGGVNESTENNGELSQGLIHIRIQQRNGRKTLTTVQGITDKFDLKKLVRTFKKEFACNGTVIEHLEYGEVIQLQGDQRNNVCQFLTRIGIAKEEQLKVCICLIIVKRRLLLTIFSISGAWVLNNTTTTTTTTTTTF